MTIAKKVKDSIDLTIEVEQEDGRRAHLGASVVGRMCEREVWYGWRWTLSKAHEARILRLFERGHKEEFRFEKWLDDISDEFWALDPATGSQIRISDYHGYFGGSLDGVVRNPAGVKGNFLCEFKTHNEKSYEKLIVSGVQSSKPEHYTQMQIYLKYKPKLTGALYFAINKNTDALYVEFVERDEQWIKDSTEKVERILLSKEPCGRHNAASEHHYYCKYFCDFPDVCFGNKEPDMSCRTCAFVETRDQGWTCGKDETLLTVDNQKAGCSDYERLF